MKALVKVSLKYGAFCSLLMIGAFFLMARFEITPIARSINSFFIDLIIFFGFVFFGTKEFKDYRNNSILHFWQGMTIGMVIIFTTAVIFCLFSATYYMVFPEAFQKYLSDAVVIFENQKPLLLERLSEEEYQQELENLKETGVSSVAFTSFLKKSGVGFLIAPLVSIILRKRPKQ